VFGLGRRGCQTLLAFPDSISPSGPVSPSHNHGHSEESLKGALFLTLPPLLERAFSLAPWLLLDLTGLN
jgi:hypothetical protein